VFLLGDQRVQRLGVRLRSLGDLVSRWDEPHVDWQSPEPPDFDLEGVRRHCISLRILKDSRR
jgi:hypothetical protein